MTGANAIVMNNDLTITQARVTMPLMACDKDNERLIEKRDLIRIAILLAIALVIGIYLIATTVLISKDGVFYIERAQQLAGYPDKVIEAHPSYPPPGYSFLIFTAHKCAALFADDLSLFTWIYAAQGVTLLCMLLALIALYLIGKLFVGSKQSFWAILILIILPYPAHMVRDVIRVWPHVLFLACGLLALLYGAKSGKWWLFGVAGVAAGLGHTIRPQCLQVVLYGSVWLLFRFWRPAPDFGRMRCVLSILVMTAGLGAVMAPYAKARGRVLPPGLKDLITSAETDKTEGEVYAVGQSCMAGFAGEGVLKGLGRLSDRLCQNLMYFFVPPLLIGLYLRFCKGRKVEDIEKVITGGVITLYIAMLVALHIERGYISRRHCVPLVIFMVFYIPAGIEAMAQWWCSKTKKNSRKDVSRMTVILLAIGIGICLPKLLGNGHSKVGYLAAAKWIRANTAKDAVIAVPDRRITFYAERKGIMILRPMDRVSGDYYVELLEGDEKGGEASYWLDHRKRTKVVLYCGSEK